MSPQEYTILGMVVTLALVLANILKVMAERFIPRLANGNGRFTAEDRACLHLLVAKHGIGANVNDVMELLTDIQQAIRQFKQAPAEHEDILRILRNIRVGVDDLKVKE